MERNECKVEPGEGENLANIMWALGINHAWTQNYPLDFLVMQANKSLALFNLSKVSWNIFVTCKYMSSK